MNWQMPWCRPVTPEECPLTLWFENQLEKGDKQVSCIRLNLIDFSEARSGEVHGSSGDAFIAALSAEPETIAELELAAGRFNKPAAESRGLPFLDPFENFEPYDAGIVIIDLAARIVMIDSTYSWPASISDADEEPHVLPLTDESDPSPRGSAGKEPTIYGIHYHNGEELTDVYLPYRIPDDWKFLSGVPEYKGERDERREARRNIVWSDARAVLFGNPLCRFIAEEILTAPDPEAEDLFTDIHARWLTTKRDDLDGRSPREVLLEKQDFIDFDLHSRQMQWSFTGECPPSLVPNAHAYRCGGFGTHEIVIYYDLVRLLLYACRERLRENRERFVEIEAPRLAHMMDLWLETPNDEYQHKPPGQVIEWERRRIPMAISGKEAMVDDNCPVCQAMAEDMGPYFWNLDSSGMEDRFEFSFHQTKEDFDAERREWEEFSRRHHEKSIFQKSMSMRMV